MQVTKTSIFLNHDQLLIESSPFALRWEEACLGLLTTFVFNFNPCSTLLHLRVLPYGTPELLHLYWFCMRILISSIILFSNHFFHFELRFCLWLMVSGFAVGELYYWQCLRYCLCFCPLLVWVSTIIYWMCLLGFFPVVSMVLWSEEGVIL